MWQTYSSRIMREVSVHRDITVVGLHQSVLAAAGIACFIKNENTPGLGAGMLGLVRSPIFDPVLCVVDDEKYDQAVELLRDHVTRPVEPAADWTCAACKESVPASFDACWNCQTPNPSNDAGDPGQQATES